jgi:hypothetical protein
MIDRGMLVVQLGCQKKGAAEALKASAAQPLHLAQCGAGM